MSGQRKLHQNAVHVLPGVQFLNQGKQFFLRRRFFQFIGKAVDSKLLTGSLFVSDIDTRCGVLTDLNNRQRYVNVAFCPLRSLFLSFLLDLSGNRSSVNSFCHVVGSSLGYFSGNGSEQPCDLSVLVHIDIDGSRNLRQSGHRHHRTGQRNHKAGACGYIHVANRNRKAFRAS